MFFDTIQDTKVLLKRRGGYIVASLYHRGGRVFAKIGQSYHPLTSNHSVSGSPDTSWVEFDGLRKDDLIVGTLDVRLATAEKILATQLLAGAVAPREGDAAPYCNRQAA